MTVQDPAIAKRLRAKAVAGEDLPGGGLRLSLVEAAYCAGAGWLDVQANGKPVPPLGVLALAPDARRALTDFLVYRDLRERGFVARHAPGTSHFDVWPRGTSVGPTLFQNVCCSAADPVRTSDLLDGAGGILCSVVDEDSTVTHYEVAEERPAGEVDWAGLPKAAGRRVADRIQVEDAAAVAAYAKAHVGTATSGAALLSPLEAEALRRAGKLAIDGPIEAPAEQVAAYEALRAVGVVPKSGLRFGAHLRAYRADPDATHADWLVHCAGTAPLSWIDLARGVRLAHGVKKQFLVAVVDGPRVRFLALSWRRL